MNIKIFSVVVVILLIVTATAVMYTVRQEVQANRVVRIVGIDVETGRVEGLDIEVKNLESILTKVKGDVITVCSIKNDRCILVEKHKLEQ